VESSGPLPEAKEHFDGRKVALWASPELHLDKRARGSPEVEGIEAPGSLY